MIVFIKYFISSNLINFFLGPSSVFLLVFFMTTHTDPLVVAGLYKLFFRQLSPPLLTYSLYDKWIHAQQQENQLAYVVTMRSLFAALPESHQIVSLCFSKK